MPARISAKGKGKQMKKVIPAAGVAAVVLLAMLASGCGGSAGKASGAPAASPTGSPPPKGVLAVIRTPGGPLGIATGFGSVWVTSENGSVLYRIDPAANKVIARIDVGHAMCGVPGIGFGRVWVPDCDFGPQGLVVVDPATNRVVRAIGDQVAGSVGLGAGSVWAGPRIDPATLREQPLLNTGHDDLAIAFGDGAVWVSDALYPSYHGHRHATVFRIDPATGKVTATIRAGVTSIQNWPMFDAGKLWVYPWLQNPARGDAAGDKIWRIDPRTNTATEMTIPHIDFANLNTAFTAGMGSLWVRGQPTGLRIVGNDLVGGDSLFRVDPRTLKVTGKYPVAAGTWGFMATGFGSLWVANFDNDTIWRDKVNG
jgi:DNA-binding beta-propeller fold protein YncE